MTTRSVPAVVGGDARHPARLVVRRAWPGEDGHLVIEATDPSGRVVAGRWHPEHGAEIGPVGHDDALPGLRPLVERGGEIVSHRHRRRAVVRVDTRFVKVVRPRRAADLAARHLSVTDVLGTEADAWFRVPALVGLDPGRGWLTFDVVPGRPILDGPDPGAACFRAGRALRRLAEGARGDLPVHTAADEVAVLDRWRADAERFEAIPSLLGRVLDRLVDRASSDLLSLGARRLAVAHRDLHDGQIFVDDGRTSLLDLDTASLADPALDVGNLLAHVDLARCQGRLSGVAAKAAEHAFLAGRGADSDDRAVVEVHRRVARLRLVAVHAFRPRSRRAALSLLGEVQPGATSR